MHVDQVNQETLPLNQCRKVFVQRDYSQGLTVKFQTKLPQELHGKVQEFTFDKTVRDLNAMYEDAERVGGKSVCETMLSCVTCHLSQFCYENQYDKQLKRIGAYLKEQNEKIYQPQGLWITDPIERGLRVIEISILHEPAQLHPS